MFEVGDRVRSGQRVGVFGGMHPIHDGALVRFDGDGGQSLTRLSSLEREKPALKFHPDAFAMVWPADDKRVPIATPNWIAKEALRVAINAGYDVDHVRVWFTGNNWAECARVSSEHPLRCRLELLLPMRATDLICYDVEDIREELRPRVLEAAERKLGAVTKYDTLYGYGVIDAAGCYDPGRHVE